MIRPGLADIFVVLPGLYNGDASGRRCNGVVEYPDRAVIIAKLCRISADRIIDTLAFHFRQHDLLVIHHTGKLIGGRIPSIHHIVDLGVLFLLKNDLLRPLIGAGRQRGSRFCQFVSSQDIDSDRHRDFTGGIRPSVGIIFFGDLYLGPLSLIVIGASFCCGQIPLYSEALFILDGRIIRSLIRRHCLPPDLSLDFLVQDSPFHYASGFLSNDLNLRRQYCSNIFPGGCIWHFQFRLDRYLKDFGLTHDPSILRCKSLPPEIGTCSVGGHTDQSGRSPLRFLSVHIDFYVFVKNISIGRDQRKFCRIAPSKLEAAIPVRIIQEPVKDRNHAQL